MGSSLDTWVRVPRAHPGNTGREAALPSSGCGLGRARQGLGGYRPALASRGLGSASRPCGVAGAWLSTRVPQAHAHTSSSPVGGGGGGLPAHLRRPKRRSTINIRNNIDKTVYCSRPLCLPPELGEVGMAREGSGPARASAVCTNGGVFV